MSSKTTARKPGAATRLRAAGKIMGDIEMGKRENNAQAQRLIRQHLIDANNQLLASEAGNKLDFKTSDLYWETLDVATKLGVIYGHLQGVARITGHYRAVKL